MLHEVQCEVSTVSDDLGCHVIGWCWSTVFSEVHSQCSHLPGNFRALHASFCWQALWRCWFHFPAGLGTCPHCQRYQKLVQWPWCYCAWLASKLAWPGIVKRKMRDTRPNNADDLKATVKETWASIRAVTITALPHHRGNEMPTAVLRSSPSSPHFFCKVFAGGSCLHSAGLNQISCE